MAKPKLTEEERRLYDERLSKAKEIDPATNGIMIDNAGGWFGHRDYHPTTELQEEDE